MLERKYYWDVVLPQLNLPLTDQYPLVRLEDDPAFHPLADHPVLMLVALTGTGKTTTLNCMRDLLGGDGMDLIPSRREVADWIALPTVQTLRGEPLRPVNDRVQRFHYTKFFAERVPGGMATAFSWLQLANRYEGLVISEGIRGAQEISHALQHFPRWTIIELSLHPLTRLRRLSGRQESFDQAAGEPQLSFLPRTLQDEARALLAAGEITDLALKIMAAEAANYGLYPFADGASYANYHCLPVDGLAPEEVANHARDIIAVAHNVDS